MSVFPRFVLFYRVLGCFSAMGVQEHRKKVLPKNLVDFFYKKIDKKIPNRFLLGFIFSSFGRFSVRGVQKYD
jgi:hypothetical protein